MATETFYISGKAKWAHIHKPDPKYGKFSITIYPNEESLNYITENLMKRTPRIKNELKKDDDGYYIRFNCEPNQTWGGKVMINTIRVVDKDKAPFHSAVGNGSDVTAEIDYYTFKRREGAAVRLRAVRVDNHVPFDPNSHFPAGEAEEMKGLNEQPTPLF